MKKFILGLIATLGLTAGASAASTDTISIVVYSDEAVEAVVPVEQKVVEIHMTKKEPVLTEAKLKKRFAKPIPMPLSAGTCSGEFIGDEGEILTAKHCVTGFDSFEVQTYDRRTYVATVIATSKTHDLAIIRIDRDNTPYFKLAESAVRGESVSILGSPLGFTDTLSEGVIAKLEGDTILLDCGALPGNSGGPIFNAKQELVGVLTAGYTVMLGVTHLNQGQSIDAVRFFIREVAQFYEGNRR